jgi:hypothetical protein
MNNLKWVIEDGKYLLKKDARTLLDLTINLEKGSLFTIGKKQFRINRKGFWKTAFTVTCNDKEILTLSDSFWGNNGKIIFNDGTIYRFKFTTRGGLKMWFMEGENELLRYTASFDNRKYVMGFSTGRPAIESEKLLVLAALGMAIFTSSYIDNSAGGDDGLLLMIAGSV